MPKNSPDVPSLNVEVRNAAGEIVENAKVALQSGGRAKAVQLKFDKRSGLYVAKSVPSGRLQIDVKHTRLQSQTREVVAGERSTELFILGEKGAKTYFMEKVRVPVTAEPGLFAVTLARNSLTDKNFEEALVREMKLERQSVPELAEKAGVRLFQARRQSDINGLLQRLADNPRIEYAGAVVGMREQGFSFLTGDVVVRFRGVRLEEAREIGKEMGYRLVRELIYSPTTYVFRWLKPATLDMLASIEKFAARDDVEWAEPSLAVTPEVDSITPTDFLWDGLWDRQLIGVQDAWQSLQDAGLDTFGDPDIVLAVWDSGVESVGGVPTNPDFQGNVSNGNPKLLASYDFQNMVANNDGAWGDHGSGVAGVSVALANNPAPVPGPAYGVVGSAPNVQIMTLVGRFPYIDIEVGDQYLWMAGFNPQSPIAGFPNAALPPRGADVITCSLTPGAGAPLSGTARAALDFVTTFGRGGKGTMCFFSTGNANQNNVTARPWGAYEKSFGIAGTSFADDGVTEIRAPFSGWGQIALCSPTQDQLGTVHNPPTGFMPWAADELGAGNLISYAQSSTTLSAATVAGAATLTVASVAGFAVGSWIYIGGIGALGSEPAMVSAVNVGTNQLTLSAGLLNAHAIGDAIRTGPANHRNNFGGTSSATPLCAGVGALVLSANPSLTYIEAREILRNTAVKFDLANTDPVGQWLDANGNPSVTSGLPAVKSGWYGYGRVDAAAAVDTAVSFGLTRDLVIRDNLADNGTVATPGAFWDSPDIWCRQDAPAGDPGAIPASYATAGPHEAPIRGQSNWIYARVKNTGTTASLDAWVRLSITHWPGLEFTYPTSFQPLTGPGDPLPSPMQPGTYFIGEAKVTGLAPGANVIVNVEWPSALIPPEDVVTPMGTVDWHPCLLAEITPHDGPSPTGNHVWDDNNLAQKNISIIDADAGSDFAMATVIGHQDNLADFLWLEVLRGRMPADVQLFVDVLDPRLIRKLREYDRRDPKDPTPTHDCRCRCRCECEPYSNGQATSLTHVPQRQGWSIGFHEGREVVVLKPQARVRIPIFGGPGSISPLVVGGRIGTKAKTASYEVVLMQRQPNGDVSGSATMMLNVEK